MYKYLKQIENFIQFFPNEEADKMRRRMNKVKEDIEQDNKIFEKSEVNFEKMRDFAFNIMIEIYCDILGVGVQEDLQKQLDDRESVIEMFKKLVETNDIPDFQQRFDEDLEKWKKEHKLSTHTTTSFENAKLCQAEEMQDCNNIRSLEKHLQAVKKVVKNKTEETVKFKNILFELKKELKMYKRKKDKLTDEDKHEILEKVKNLCAENGVDFELAIQIYAAEDEKEEITDITLGKFRFIFISNYWI